MISMNARLLVALLVFISPPISYALKLKFSVRNNFTSGETIRLGVLTENDIYYTRYSHRLQKKVLRGENLSWEYKIRKVPMTRGFKCLVERYDPVTFEPYVFGKFEVIQGSRLRGYEHLSEEWLFEYFIDEEGGEIYTAEGHVRIPRWQFYRA